MLQNVASLETEIKHHLLPITLKDCPADPRFIFLNTVDKKQLASNVAI